MRLRTGDRVRVIQPDGPYTGSRGSIARDPNGADPAEDSEPLGYYVAIDGENGRTRPFLAQDLELLGAARARPGRRAASREAGSDRA